MGFYGLERYNNVINRQHIVSDCIEINVITTPQHGPFAHMYA